MSKQKIILIGGGGHCKSCIDVIEAEGRFEIAGIIDLPDKIGQNIFGYDIIGSDDDLPNLANQYDNFFITFGQIKSPDIRVKIFNKMEALGVNMPVIISPYAGVSKHAEIGKGTIIMHHAFVNAGATVGINCIVNSKALIDHDALVGNHCYISTAAVVNGGVEVGEKSYIGSASTNVQYVKIVPNTIVGAGAVVTKDILSSGIYTGVPAKKTT